MCKLVKTFRGLSRTQKFIVLVLILLSSLSVEFGLKIESSTEVEDNSLIEQIKDDWSIESTIKINGAS